MGVASPRSFRGDRRNGNLPAEIAEGEQVLLVDEDEFPEGPRLGSRSKRRSSGTTTDGRPFGSGTRVDGCRGHGARFSIRPGRGGGGPRGRRLLTLYRDFGREVKVGIRRKV